MRCAGIWSLCYACERYLLRDCGAKCIRVGVASSADCPLAGRVLGTAPRITGRSAASGCSMLAPQEDCPCCGGVWSDQADGGKGPCRRCSGSGQVVETPTCFFCGGSLVSAPGHDEPWCYGCRYNVPSDCKACKATEGSLCDLHAGEMPVDAYDTDAQVWEKRIATIC